MIGIPKMSSRHPYTVAMPVAQDLLAALRPHCSRIVIAGSLRRRKPDVGDIEILYVPKSGERQADMFTTETYSLADEEIVAMRNRKEIVPRLNVNGNMTWGAKNKHAVQAASGIPVDFFATTEENWWVSLVIRTGGKETNLSLTMGAQKIGRSLLAYGCGVRCSDNSIIAATSERHVFELCGVEYKEPEDRK